MTDASSERTRLRTLSDAFEASYRANRETVFRYLRARCDGIEEAEDLTATAFERAFRAFTQGNAAALELPWQIATARNAATDAGRRSQVRRALSMAWLMPDSPATPEALILAEEQRARVYEALTTLRPALRDAVALRFGAGLKVREIAPILGKTEEATQKAIERATAQMRKVLDDRH